MREPAIAALAHDFRTRLRRYAAFEEVEVAAGHGSDAVRAMDEEGRRVMRSLEPDEPLWLLERSGTQLSSPGIVARVWRKPP